jgi:D-sedoheptulose 7-phosphate isomerase
MLIAKNFEESIETKKKVLSDKRLIKNIEDTAQKIKTALKNGNKVLICGNGGSAADAQHFTAELVGRYKKERKGLAAIALTTDSSIMTAWTNDYSFDTLFSRQIEALGKKGDVFIGISTSGNSKNVIEALKKAKEIGIYCIGLTGNNGGKMNDSCDINIVVPSANTPRIQEAHITIIHAMCEVIEE